MKLSTLALATLMMTAMNAHAAPVAPFCGPMAINAARALANANGSISEVAVDAKSADGKTFEVVLSETGYGQDTYTVTTTGGHECVALSVSVVGMPTPRN